MNRSKLAALLLVTMVVGCGNQEVRYVAARDEALTGVTIKVIGDKGVIEFPTAKGKHTEPITLVDVHFQDSFQSLAPGIVPFSATLEHQRLKLEFTVMGAAIICDQCYGLGLPTKWIKDI